MGIFFERLCRAYVEEFTARQERFFLIPPNMGAAVASFSAIGDAQDFIADCGFEGDGWTICDAAGQLFPADATQQ